MEKAIEAAFAELKRQIPGTDDLSSHHSLPPYSLVLPYDGFNLRLIVEAALRAAGQ
jgi:hypothetical protein